MHTCPGKQTNWFHSLKCNEICSETDMLRIQGCETGLKRESRHVIKNAQKEYNWRATESLNCNAKCIQHRLHQWNRNKQDCYKDTSNIDAISVQCKEEICKVVLPNA